MPAYIHDSTKTTEDLEWEYNELVRKLNRAIRVGRSEARIHVLQMKTDKAQLALQRRLTAPNP